MFKKIVLAFAVLLTLAVALVGGWPGSQASTALAFYSPLPTDPIVEFFVDPFEPSVYDQVNFYDASFDPVGLGFQSWTWDFGDGVTASGPYVSHQYAANGDYTVTHTATTVDGRSGSITRVITVRTRDVAITKFARPKNGKVGKTVRLTVGVSSKIQPETVRVELYKSTPGSYDGFRLIGFLEQLTPVRSGNKTTDFLFSYTFTPDDGRVGKVNFKAVAWIVNGRDALPADNAFITLPIAVSGGSRNGLNVAESDTDEEIDDVANGDAISAPMETETGPVQLSSKVYLSAILVGEE